MSRVTREALFLLYFTSLRKLAPHFLPIRTKLEEITTCYLEFSFAVKDISPSYWPRCLLQFWFYDTQAKSVRIPKNYCSWMVVWKGTISIGNNMISSAVWCKYARVNFSKTTKLHEPVEKSRQTTFWKHARALWNLHACYNFVLVLHENKLVFSQSEARNFCMFSFSEGLVLAVTLL